MAKKKREVKKVIPITETKKDVRHVRVELPPEDYERVRKAARGNAISISAFVRMAIMRQVRREEVAD